MIVYVGCTIALLVAWARGAFVPFEWKVGVLYSSDDYLFPVVFFLDKVAAVFLFVTAYVSAIIVKFSRYYMHREEGYSRFFSKDSPFYIWHECAFFIRNG